MASEYRVVFKGEVLAGFDPAVVRNKAEIKLKTNPAQIERLFSGRSAILKKGINAELGERYVSELRRIGMVVRLEPMEEVPVPAPEAQAPIPSDLEKTQLADPLALSRFLQENPDPAHAPTLIVPSAQREQIMQAKLPTDASAPTMVVTPNSKANTLLVKQAPGMPAPHDPERTLIANPAALDAYFSPQTGSNPAALATGGISLPHSISDDLHKTQLNPAALDAYLASAPIAEAHKPQEIRSVPISVAVEEEEAVAVFAPVEPPRPFSGKIQPAPELESELIVSEESHQPFYAGPHQSKWMVGGFAVLLLVLWWLL